MGPSVLLMLYAGVLLAWPRLCGLRDLLQHNLLSDPMCCRMEGAVPAVAALYDADVYKRVLMFGLTCLARTHIVRHTVTAVLVTEYARLSAESKQALCVMLGCTCSMS